MCCLTVTRVGGYNNLSATVQALAGGQGYNKPNQTAEDRDEFDIHVTVHRDIFL